MTDPLTVESRRRRTLLFDSMKHHESICRTLRSEDRTAFAFHSIHFARAGYELTAHMLRWNELEPVEAADMIELFNRITENAASTFTPGSRGEL
ncbi:hypothetical protein [Corynebacterium faecium]|uniref:hypothetical protein n=1 Tax=Corynebacterium faecium TaxID=3016001 RepID=UPI0022B55EAA|nr:hypothetical protein [Corynebacterium faecium]